MFLSSAIQFFRKGASMPIEAWEEKFESIKGELLRDAKRAVSHLSEGAPSKLEMQRFVSILEQSLVDEKTLANQSENIINLFIGTPTAQDTLVSQFISTGKLFLSGVDARRAFVVTRAQAKRRLSEQQQREYDTRLFSKEGMMYCLEYYLMMYKILCSLPSDSARQAYILQETVDFGFGDIPGIWVDFRADEMLQKFVYHILNDDKRVRLLRAYYTCKSTFMDLQINDKNEVPTSKVPQLLNSLQLFVLSFLREYQYIGIERLGSTFLKPYGDKTKIDDVIEIISKV